MLGVEHITSRGSIMLDFYGRYICVKIMPTGVNPERFLDAFNWSDTTWRLGELKSQVGILLMLPCHQANSAEGGFTMLSHCLQCMPRC